MALNRDVKVTLVGEDRASKTFDKVGESSGGLAGKIGKLGAAVPIAGAAVAGLAIGALKVGGAFIETSSRLEELNAKSKTVFGESLPMIRKWAEKSAEAMLLTSSEAVGLATNMADLLIPMGFTRDEAAKMSTETIGLAGALSRWSGGTYSAADAADVLTSAMLGETDSLKGLGIAISAADIEARVLKNGAGELEGALRQQAEAVATQQLIFEKSTDAQAGFAAGNQTLATRLESLRVKFRQAWEELVVRLTPAAERFADWVATQGAAKLQQFVGWLEANRNAFIGMAQSALTGAADVARAFAQMVGSGTMATASLLDQAATVAGAFGNKGLEASLRTAANNIATTGAKARISLEDAAGAADALAGRLDRLKDRTVTVTVREVSFATTPRQADRNRVNGGRVSAGEAYTVGEAGREVFVPDRRGTIVPNNRLRQATAAPQTIVTQVVLDGRVLAENVRQVLNGDRINGRELGLA